MLESDQIAPVRKKQKIEIWSNGKWTIIEAIIDRSSLCKGPGCRRKIPSKRNRGDWNDTKIRGFPKKYHRVVCSKKCYRGAVKAERLKP
ncbi:MAG: hypothetical protein V3V41_00290 [Candidatus Heimdallarchaeota archaeon]